METVAKRVVYTFIKGDDQGKGKLNQQIQSRFQDHNLG